MVCDSVEATTRSLSQAGRLGPIDEAVNTIIQGLIDDEQLDEAPLTVGNLRKVKEVLHRELASQFHKRVDYAKAAEEGKTNGDSA